jgi:3-dehydroquinate synthase class II
MRRSSFCSLAVLTLFAAGLARADDSKTKNAKDNNREKATITKVDSAKGTITVTMKDQNGTKVEKTFQLAEGIEYFDKNGKAAKIDAFKPGDHVLFTEQDGKIKELKEGKEHARATITKVDAKNGTVTVMMKGKNGKEVEKTFRLTEESEYADSTGRVATIEVFQSGDEVLIVEGEGKIKELKKDTKGQPGDKDKTPSASKPDQK